MSNLKSHTNSACPNATTLEEQTSVRKREGKLGEGRGKKETFFRTILPTTSKKECFHSVDLVRCYGIGIPRQHTPNFFTFESYRTPSTAPTIAHAPACGLRAPCYAAAAAWLFSGDVGAAPTVGISMTTLLLGE